MLRGSRITEVKSSLLTELAGPRPLTDEQRSWLSELYAANFIAVFKVCCRVLGSCDDAADAAHEVFLRAADSLRPASPPAQARAWLVAVARNHCLDLLRRRRRHEAALTTLAAGPASSPEPERTVIDRQTVDAILERLGVRERQALWQSAVERRSLDQIARSLGMTYMATAQLLHRSRKRAALLAAKLAGILGFVHVRRQLQRALLLSALLPIGVALPATSSPTHPSKANAMAPRLVRPAHAIRSPAKPTHGTPVEGSQNDPTLDVSRTLSLGIPAAMPAQAPSLNSVVRRVEQTIDPVVGQLVATAGSSPYLNGH